MSKISEIREAIDTKLDQWEAGATAAETLLNQTKGQALHRYEALKKALGDASEELESELASTGVITDNKMQEAREKFDLLRVQLALGGAEARDAFEAQREEIQRSISALEAAIDQQLEASEQAVRVALLKAVNKFIVAAIKLEAEMEFLAIQFDIKKSNSWARFSHEKRALILQINRYRNQIEEKKRLSKDKVAAFEGELSDGMLKIKQAFRSLLD